MKRLNAYKIIGILVTFVLFFVIFNYLQNREADFEVDSKVFNVIESSAELDKKMNQLFPQVKLAEELDAINTYNKTIPILKLDRELKIHEAMELAYGGIYIAYSFPLKENDMPYDLPSLTVGLISYDDGDGGKQSKHVNHQEMHFPNSQKPMVIDHRVYQVAILAPEDLGSLSPNDMPRLNSSEYVTLQKLVVTEKGKKVPLDDIRLNLSNGYKESPFAEADLDTKVQVGQGTIQFTKFTANFHGNELHFKTDLVDLSHILITQQFGEHSFQNRYKVNKEEDHYTIMLQPFIEYEDEINYRITGIINDKNGSVSTTINPEELKKLKSGGSMEVGNYGGISYSIGTRERGASHALSLELVGEYPVHQEELRTFRLMNENERDQHPYREDFSSLSVEDRHGDDVLIYDIEESGNGFFINLDMGHVTSLAPAQVKLSNLPNIIPAEGEISASLTKVKKNK
ncbi:hypothetical protein [Alkalihalobacillus sp. R86527]|uniref:hypothetical protein n=1 Tax=Alkalihalobacillus sp. R86527 TaxID=3093863 RepID=UPI00366CB70E